MYRRILSSITKAYYKLQTYPKLYMLPKILERTAYVDELSGIPFALHTIERLYYEQLHLQSWKNLLKSVASQENSLTTTSYPDKYRGNVETG